jgi:hypothetical protein
MFVNDKVKAIVKKVCKELNVDAEENQDYIDEIIWSMFIDISDDMINFDLEIPLKDQIGCFFEDLETELREGLED